MAEVVLEHVSKKFGEVEAVKDVCFTCSDKEFIVLLGPSGCGKTTSLRMIAGLESVDEGNIYIDGRIVNDLSPQNRNIAMAFETYALYPSLSVYDNIGFPLRIKGRPSREIRKEVTNFAEFVSVSDILDKWPHNLTDGQKQKVSLARALIKKPSVFLLDEPISHVGEEEREELRSMLKRIHKEVGGTFVYVTHNQIEAISLADRIAVFNLGVLQQMASPSELFNRPANRFVASFVGEPPINIIACSLVESQGSFFLQSESFQIEISKEIGKAVLNEGAFQLQIGLRPWDIDTYRSRTPGYSLCGELLDCKSVSGESLLKVKVGKEILTVLIEGEFSIAESRKKANLWLSFDECKMHIFDGRSGRLILS